MICFIITEVATRDVLRKKVFLKILQSFQENTCFTVSFLIKLQASGLLLSKPYKAIIKMVMSQTLSLSEAATRGAFC